jgi:hypothetical protein
MLLLWLNLRASSWCCSNSWTLHQTTACFPHCLQAVALPGIAMTMLIKLIVAARQLLGSHFPFCSCCSFVQYGPGTHLDYWLPLEVGARVGAGKQTFTLCAQKYGVERRDLMYGMRQAPPQLRGSCCHCYCSHGTPLMLQTMLTPLLSSAFHFSCVTISVLAFISKMPTHFKDAYSQGHHRFECITFPLCAGIIGCIIPNNHSRPSGTHLPLQHMHAL